MSARVLARRVDPSPVAVLDRSPLARLGWHATSHFLGDGAVAALAAEASACHASANVQRAERPPDEDTGPRGQPARWLESAVGGPHLLALYHSPRVLAHLRAITGLAWRPSGGHGTFSYYRAPGHHLDLHRDVDDCDLAVITCIQRSGTGVPGLVLYPGRCRDSLRAIRATPDVGAVTIELAIGESLVLLGGHVPHRLPALAAGQVRVVAPLCFTLADGDGGEGRGAMLTTSRRALMNEL